MNPHRVQALVLDFGGVSSRTLCETHALTEAAPGLPTGTLTRRGPFDPAGDALWRDMQADRISERDYRLPWLVQFDVLVDATHTHTLKPDSRTYQLCLNRLDLPAAAWVFVDDHARSVVGGVRTGMRWVHFDVMGPAGSYRGALRLLGLAHP